MAPITYGVPADDGKTQDLPEREREWPLASSLRRPPFRLRVWTRAGKEWDFAEAVSALTLQEQTAELGEQLTATLKDEWVGEAAAWTRELLPLGAVVQLDVDWGTGWQPRFWGTLFDWRWEGVAGGGGITITAWDPLVRLRSEDNMAWSKIEARHAIAEILKAAGIAGPDPEEEQGPDLVVGPLIFRGEPYRDMVAGFFAAVYRNRGGEWTLRHDAVGGTQMVQPGSNHLMPRFTRETATTAHREAQTLDGFVSVVKIVATITNDDRFPYNMPVLAEVKGLTDFGLYQRIIDAGTNGQFQNVPQAEAGAKVLLNQYGRPQQTRSIEVVDLPFLRRWDRIDIDHVGTLDGNYIIESINHDLVTGRAQLELRDLVRPLLFPDVLFVPSVRVEGRGEQRTPGGDPEGMTNADTIRACVNSAQDVAGESGWRDLAVAMLTIAGIESEWNPQAKGDMRGATPTSWGIFQLHEGGQADEFIARYGREQLFNPYSQAEYKAPGMWADFKTLGGSGQMKFFPIPFLTALEMENQAPAAPPPAERVREWYDNARDAVEDEIWRDPEERSTSGLWWPFPGREGEGWYRSGYEFGVWSSASGNRHGGIDIATLSVDKTVYASGDGEVSFAGWDGGYGNKVTIRHPSTGGTEYSTVYGHFASMAVAEGQRVYAMQPIGQQGSTGLSTGPHVHFEVREDNVVISPRDNVAHACWNPDTKGAC